MGKVDEARFRMQGTKFYTKKKTLIWSTHLVALKVLKKHDREEKCHQSGTPSRACKLVPSVSFNDKIQTPSASPRCQKGKTEVFSFSYKEEVFLVDKQKKKEVFLLLKH